MKIAPLRWFRNISIAKKLYFTIGIMALLIAIELGTLFFCINTLSSVRAYVGGEGLWSKAQKDALYNLVNYGNTRKEEYYVHFHNFMQIPLGDSRARQEMTKAKPDWNIVRQGFIQGGNHPNDVDGMIKLFRRFKDVSYIKRAAISWIKADSAALELFSIAEQLHSQIKSRSPSDDSIKAILAKIDPVNTRLTHIENEFSYTLGEGSRWLENLVLKILFIIALTVEISGLILAISLSRSLQKGLTEIIAASVAFAKGDFTKRSRVFSKDEIGTLAVAFNEMATKLEQAITSLHTTETRLLKYNQELELKNNELGQFAYVASHDLQEPLNTISGFVILLETKYKDMFDEDDKTYVNYIVEASARMKDLIEILLDYSRIGRDHQPEMVDCNTIVSQTLADLGATVQKSKASITCSHLPSLKAYPTELKLLFQNLINNAIKFQRAGNQPVIHIAASQISEGWLFTVSDNGIGIKKENKEKIFIIFKRLHSRKQFDGTGIGLAQCAKIVTLHGGKIWVESELDKGATFCFVLRQDHFN